MQSIVYIIKLVSSIVVAIMAAAFAVMSFPIFLIKHMFFVVNNNIWWIIAAFFALFAFIVDFQQDLLYIKISASSMQMMIAMATACIIFKVCCAYAAIKSDGYELEKKEDTDSGDKSRKNNVWCIAILVIYIPYSFLMSFTGRLSITSQSDADKQSLSQSIADKQKEQLQLTAKIDHYISINYIDLSKPLQSDLKELNREIADLRNQQRIDSSQIYSTLSDFTGGRVSHKQIDGFLAIAFSLLCTIAGAFLSMIASQGWLKSRRRARVYKQGLVALGALQDAQSSILVASIKNLKNGLRKQRKAVRGTDDKDQSDLDVFSDRSGGDLKKGQTGLSLVQTGIKKILDRPQKKARTRLKSKQPDQLRDEEIAAMINIENGNRAITGASALSQRQAIRLIKDRTKKCIGVERVRRCMKLAKDNSNVISFK